MRKCICGFVRLTDEIAELFGLKTYHQIPVITCDGRDGLVNYVYDPEEISIDPYRLLLRGRSRHRYRVLP